VRPKNDKKKTRAVDYRPQKLAKKFRREKENETRLKRTPLGTVPKKSFKLGTMPPKLEE